MSYHVKYTLAAALNASFAEPRINIVLTHLVSRASGVGGLSDNAVE